MRDVMSCHRYKTFFVLLTNVVSDTSLLSRHETMNETSKQKVHIINVVAIKRKNVSPFPKFSEATKPTEARPRNCKIKVNSNFCNITFS